MVVDDQVRFGIVLAYVAGVGTLVILLGMLLEWILGPVQPEHMRVDDDVELPAFVRPLNRVVTGTCVLCHEPRLERDLERVDGLGQVCAGGCRRAA